ncbi:MAG: alpha/beta fold hydrolase [Bacteroidota bacterium]|nr:alpha/beta fold hydrolase [Bacteroidota bacterium]
MKLAYRDFGTGQPLLILHGLFGQSDNWNTLAKNFADKGFHVYTLDQRNHGLSPHSNEWDYEIMADDLKKFIDDHDLKKPILLGHSMGGKTVLFFELKYNGVADKLIIADIAARAYPPHHGEVLKALHAVDFKTISTRKEAEAIMNNYLGDFGTKQFLLKNIYWSDDENKQMAWRFNLKTISEEYDNIGVAVPDFISPTETLIINGEKSNYINALDKLDFEKRFTNVRFKTILNAGHWVHAEKPKEFFEAVLRFLV